MRNLKLFRRLLLILGLLVLIYKIIVPTECPVPSLRYSVIIDCGSTGSRVHIYRFNYVDNEPRLLNETFEHLEPGLSHYSDPSQSAQSLKPLFDLALHVIPHELHKQTTISVKATAGLRMLEGDLSSRIIQKVQDMVNELPFLKLDKVGVMDGKEEGILAWITLNYLLNTIGNNKPTAGVMDLGGGSTQIVFESDSGTQLLKFGQRIYNLYVHSYDGYGLISAREKIQKSGQCSTNCIEQISKVMFDKSLCSHKSCSFDGVFMPKLNGKMYAFSYFYDKYAEPFEKSEFKLPDLHLAHSSICQKDTNTLSPLGMKEFEKNENWCSDLSYMYSLLNNYNIGDLEIKTTKKINDIEIGWALGLAIQNLDLQLHHC